MSDLCLLGVCQLVRQIAAREVSPVEVVRAHLARIDRLDGRLKSFLTVFADEAVREAQRAEAVLSGGAAPGPLHGVPVAVKDLFDVRGFPTTAGSRLLNTPAGHDSTVVARLRAAGAVILGKLNLHEFAYGPEGVNLHFGTPWNPWDAQTHRLPGGSSSGSGVAVAAGLVPMGLGSDTGGSIRIPAACCGVVGLKPTYGRVSRAGVVPLCWSLDHVGPLTGSVADAATVLGVIAGHDPADPSTSGRSVPPYAAELHRPVQGLRIGLLADCLEQSDPEVASAVSEAARLLRGLGCRIEEVRPARMRYATAAISAIAAPEALAYHDPMLRQHAPAYAPDVRRRVAVGYFLSGADYLKGQRARRLIRDEVEELFGRVDCLLGPTVPVAAPPLGAAEVPIRGRAENTRSALLRFTRPFNLTGHPAVAVPCGFSRDGLPLSLQIAGRAFDEATVLRLAHAYEQATDWHRRRPPLLSNEAVSPASGPGTSGTQA